MTGTSAPAPWLRGLVAAGCAVCGLTPVAAVAVGLELHDGANAQVTRYGVGGDRVLVCLPVAHGEEEGQRAVARGLASLGVEVWTADLLSARFLPATAGSLAAIPVEDVVALVRMAQDQSGKAVFLFADGRAAGPAVRAATRLQRTAGARPLAGLILFSPILYEGEPAPGGMPPYIPETGELAGAVYILQPELSAGRWWLPRLTGEIEGGGGRVVVRVLPGVRDGFYYREDLSAAEQAARPLLSGWLAQGMDAIDTPATGADHP